MSNLISQYFLLDPMLEACIFPPHAKLLPGQLSLLTEEKTKLD